MTFWCQALDNQSDDIYAVWKNDKLNRITDTNTQRTLNQAIARTRQQGQRLRDTDQIQADIYFPPILANDGEFLLQLATTSKDVAGRRVIITCHGDTKAENQAVWQDQIISAIDAFTTEQSLPLNVDDSELRHVLNEIADKKKARRNIQLTVGGVLAASAALILIWILRAL
ncbi:hypothetical protein FRC96_15060 [Lujinxingia vulgaris]|uniref:Uncharacterized protein n=1 Tax=Lujinxingia vulgaris TaxID=2600176 RepID=A0A5C6X978_9DELT|nr:hypothetical protein [Lujinxingia vulgaris]TXD33789.1 hypothetical protein FRC96_15060 [Lujinxingia vulgaris]